MVFTDGDDTASRITFDTVLDRARDEGVMVYAIGLEAEYFNGARVVKSRPSRDLKKIAEETGGGYFELVKTADLAPTFSRVVQELRSQVLARIHARRPGWQDTQVGASRLQTGHGRPHAKELRCRAGAR